ncbi:hypothetical protein [Nocardia sp. CA-290969]|uniref:hypothetical protein n=1 Tax=Nocardia sp. CA-290969 TaxID=3239986 RepID=UPI003D91DAEF
MSDPTMPLPEWQPQLTEQSLDARRQAMAMAVASEVAAGGRVESQTDTTAVIVRGSKPNHTLHLILSLVTCGCWLFVWPIIAIVQKEHRTALQVDPYGQVLRQVLS